MSEVEHIGPFRLAPHVRDGKPTGGWILDLRKSNSRKGRRQRKFFANREIAIKCAREYERKAYTGSMPVFSQASANASRISLFQLLEDWERDQKLDVAAGAKRQSSLVRDMDHFVSVKVFLRDVRVSEITEAKLKEYVAWRVKKGMSLATVKTDIVAVGKVLRWAVKKQLLGAMPELPKVRAAKRRLDVPTQEEIGRIIDALPDRLKLLGKFLASTGCRKGEALNLRWSDIDLKDRRVYITSREGWTPKTEHSERDFSIEDEILFAELVASRDGKSEYVFPGSDPKKPIRYFRKSFAAAVLKAGIMRGDRCLKVTPHSLRKAWATWAATEAKLHPALIKRMMGHSPTSTVTDGWYIATPPEALKAAWRKLETPPPIQGGATLGQQPQKQNGPLISEKAI